MVSWRHARRLVVVGYLVLLVGWPMSLVVQATFADGLDTLARTLGDPAVRSALGLTVVVAASAVVVNTVFGVGMSLLLVRTEFRGKRVLSALLDLPLSVSPVVVGLAIVLAYGQDGWFGPALEDAGFRVVFALPGIVLATAFVSLPLVIREVVPVLTEIGTDEEQAARSLGAGAWPTFWRITLPAIKWAVVYGVVLTMARSLGEFGAVKIVSGNLEGATQTATLLVEQRYQDFDQGAAYATAFLLAAVSVACIVVISFLRPEEKP
ncbi:sulfate ABC transporter permease subunit CysW [Flavimobilis marinus]|uniref:Sulfate transport system permease protein n=1 Tax=Flavimobilis marinus TaxID=285351 RepID=A0A1I2H2V4_9MICO|nr:sulfate ABC transporter permease subunit [Flavimobilis marinus]GHG54501.1 sulfate ABC transporter permease subunit CysW [Flavimobilis marinus]SFF23629.1 sulfate transport system permease protein [Flavimobilis marinus]